MGRDLRCKLRNLIFIVFNNAINAVRECAWSVIKRSPKKSTPIHDNFYMTIAKEKAAKSMHMLASLMDRHGIKAAKIAALVLSERTGKPISRQTVEQTTKGRFIPTLDTIVRYLDAINLLADTSYSLKDIDYTDVDSDAAIEEQKVFSKKIGLKSQK
ncbi:MAG: hypothetical protein ACRCVX_14135 [Shewanella sp.]